MRSVVVSMLPSLGDLSKSRTLYSLAAAGKSGYQCFGCRVARFGLTHRLFASITNILGPNKRASAALRWFSYSRLQARQYQVWI